MASFIQGLTDQFGPIDLFKPDYSMLSQGAGTLENRLQQGRQQISSLYSSLLNAPLSTQSNIKFRDEFFQKVNDEFKRMARLDVSKQSNQIKAESLLDPLVNDQDFLTDMAKTKFYQGEFQKLEALKHSTDPNLRKQYNPIAEQYLQQEYGRLQQATRGDGSIARIQNRKFQAWEDPMEFLSKAAIEDKIKITRDSTSGFYKITDTNGKESIQTFEQWAAMRLGNRFDEQNRIEKEVLTDNYFTTKSNQGVSREQAARDFAEQYHIPLQVDFERYTGGLQRQVTMAEQEIERLKREGKGKIHKSKAAEVQQLRALIDQTNQTLEDAQHNRISLEKDMQSNLEAVAKNPSVYLGDSLKRRTISQWASTYAMATAEHKIDEDPVKMKLEHERQENARLGQRIAADARMQSQRLGFEAQQNKLKHGWDLELEDRRSKNNMTEAAFKASIEAGKDGKGGVGGGAVLGAETLTENRTLAQADQIRMQQLDQTSSDLLHDPDALVVAAHIKRNGSMISDTISPSQISQLLDKSKNATVLHNGGLNTQERALMTSYLNRISPGTKYSNYYNAIRTITEGIKKNATDPDFKDGFGAQAKKKFFNGLNAMQEYTNTHFANQKYLASMYARGSEFAEHIGVNNGVYYIKDPANTVSGGWVRDPENLKNYTQSSLQSVILTNPTEKTDPAFVSGLLTQVTGVGQINQGNFKRLDPESLSSIRALNGIGTENLSKVLDLQGARIMKVVDGNGKASIQVEIGVKRNSKGESMASEYIPKGDLRDSMEANNKITFQIGTENVSRMMSGNRSIPLPGGGRISLPNSLSDKLKDFTSDRDLNINALSGLANLKVGGKYPLPSSFDVLGTKGYLTTNRNGEVVAVLNINGTPTEGPTGMHISDFQQHPDQAPKQLQAAIQNMAFHSYDQIQKTKEGQRQRQIQSQQSHPDDYVNIDDIH